MKKHILVVACAFCLTGCFFVDENVTTTNYAKDPERFKDSVYVLTDRNPAHFEHQIPPSVLYDKQFESEPIRFADYGFTEDKHKCFPFDTIKVFEVFKYIALAYVCDQEVEPHCRDNDFVVIRKQWDLPLQNGTIIHLHDDKCFELDEYVSDNEMNIVIPSVKIALKKQLLYNTLSFALLFDEYPNERDKIRVKLAEVATKKDFMEWRKKRTLDEYKNCYMCFELEEDENVKEQGIKMCKQIEASRREPYGYSGWNLDVDTLSACKTYPEMGNIHYQC